MSSDKFLVPAVLTQRTSGRGARNAAGWCKRFRFHRFCAVASSPEEARELILAFVTSEPFSSVYKSTDSKVGLTILFPDGPGITPIDKSNLFLHLGVVRGRAGEDGANYRTLVAASTPVMADWKARESHFSRAVAGARRPELPILEFESFVVPCHADLTYLGRSNLIEAEALFRKTYIALADEADAESGGSRPVLVGSPEDAGQLFRELSQETKLCLPLSPTDEQITRAWILEQSGDSSARHMSDGSEDGERVLSAFLARITPGLFQTHSHDVVGAGVTEIDERAIELVRGSDLLSSGRGT